MIGATHQLPVGLIVYGIIVVFLIVRLFNILGKQTDAQVPEASLDSQDRSKFKQWLFEPPPALTHAPTRSKFARWLGIRTGPVPRSHLRSRTAQRKPPQGHEAEIATHGLVPPTVVVEDPAYVLTGLAPLGDGNWEIGIGSRSSLGSGSTYTRISRGTTAVHMGDTTIRIYWP